MPAVCFSVFDHASGPRPIFHPGIDHKMALKIALKSQMTLSMMSEKTIETSDAVLPFPEEQKIAYVFLFTIKGEFGKEKRSVASLSFIVDQNQQMNFYKQVTLLRYQAEQIADMIRHVYQYSPKKASLPKNLEKSIEDWGSDLASVEMEITEEIRKKKITIRRAEQRGSISFLRTTIRKNADRLIRAVIAGNPIILIGDEPLIDLMQSTLEIFAPHRVLRKIAYTEEFVHPSEADLLGMSVQLSNHYSDEIIVDLRKGKINRGTNCKFSKKLLDQIKDLDQEKAERVVNSRVNFLISKVNALVDLAGGEAVNDEAISAFRKSVDKDALDLIMSIAAQTNPMIAELLRDRVQARYSDWMTEL
ncbi:MAG: hypothetical protein ACFFCQ_00160 [Promethearchaeota archaeon]